MLIFTKSFRSIFFFTTLFLFFFAYQSTAQDFYKSTNFEKYYAANDSVKAFTTEENSVVFMGNSITEAWPILSPDFFKDHQYIGRGISGQTSYQMLFRFRREVIDLQPKVVVLLAGTNDIAQNTGYTPIDIIAENVMTMVELAQYHNIEEFYAGVKEACRVYNVDLIGGDTTSSPKGLYISITAIGQAESEKIVYRNTAKVGDIICVTGDLGAAYLGLQLLEREKQLYLSDPNVKTDLEGQNYLVGRQLKPEARKDVIERFDKNDLVPTSMIDVSDGLASELFHICTQSKVGAFIEEKGVPIHDDTQLMAIKFKLDPITCALSGGEDYELLFTINPADIDKVKFLPDLYIIGDIVDQKDGVKLHTIGGNIHPIKAQGWQHFGN